MRFPRNAKILRGQLDAAPFATVFFLLVILVMLSALVYTPGIPVRLTLPLATDVAGTDKPAASVAVDAGGRLYYQNQIIERPQLRDRLKALAADSPEPMALIIQADKNTSHETLARLALIARDAGFAEARLAVLPRTPPLPKGLRQSPP
jgi:biopolymer transport protein ExbD